MNTFSTLRTHARKIFFSGIRAVDPENNVKKHCHRVGNTLVIADRQYDLAAYQNVFVIGGGKASAPMAAAIESLIGDHITTGVVSVKYGHTEDLQQIRIIEAGHPIPDQNGRKAAEKMIRIVESADENDLIICLISGGGSALLPLPVETVSLSEKQRLTKVLIACGATIHEINAVRKHISRIKGGRLGSAAYPAEFVALILSDVVGDDLDVIASGPAVADESTFADCLRIFDKYDIVHKTPQAILDHIQAGKRGNIAETPKRGALELSRIYNCVIAGNMAALLAAEKTAKHLGYETLLLSSLIEGESRQTARFHMAIAKEILKSGHPVHPPACILSGGETTVKITGNGQGGRNQEFSLAAALEMPDGQKIVVLSGGTDGTDGPTDAAGAIADGMTVKRAKAAGFNPENYLKNNDSYHFFEPLNDLIITGPTRTNVMDLRIILMDC